MDLEVAYLRSTPRAKILIMCACYGQILCSKYHQGEWRINNVNALIFFDCMSEYFGLVQSQVLYISYCSSWSDMIFDILLI